MNISNVCFGYYEDGNLILKELLMSNDQYNDISKKVVIKNRDLPSLRNTIENNSNNKRFSIKDADYNEENSDNENENYYHLDLIKGLHKGIIENNTFVKNINELNDSNYKFIVYFGNTDTDNQELGAIFPVKQNLLFKRQKLLILFDSPKGSSEEPNLKNVPSENLIQLPHDNSIATFYVKNKDNNKNIFKLNVFKPIDFDDVFNADYLKNSFSKRTLERFTSSDEKLKLTTDGLNVSFIKKDEDESKDDDSYEIESNENIIKKIHSRDVLTDTIANFSGNGNCTIQNIDKKQLVRVLNEMTEYAETDAGCNYDIKNIPQIKDDNLFVTVDSIPIFCSLLNNHVIKKLLTNTIRVPYYDKYSE